MPHEGTIALCSLKVKLFEKGFDKMPRFKFVFKERGRNVRIKADQMRNYVPLHNRNHDDDPVKPEQSHRISPRKAGDPCRCGGMNPNCPHCGGNGIIPT